MPITVPEWDCVFPFIHKSLHLTWHGRPFWPTKVNKLQDALRWVKTYCNDIITINGTTTQNTCELFFSPIRGNPYDPHDDHVTAYTCSCIKDIILKTNVLLFFFLPAVHLSITLVNDQLDAQFFYFIIRLLQSSTCFEQRRAHHQEVKLY